MTRLNGRSSDGRVWLWIILIILLIMAVVLLDYFDVIPLHLI